MKSLPESSEDTGLARATTKEVCRLPQDAAFVVSFQASDSRQPALLNGRAEHIRSGETLRFGTAEELVEFFAAVLGRINDQKGRG